MSQHTGHNDKSNVPNQEIVKEKSIELLCDSCGFYPIEPIHGHFVCPSCKMPTKCCEGIALVAGD